MARLKFFVNTLLSLLYAYRLASIPSELLSDRYNYSIWYKYADERLASIDSILSFLAKEPLFYLINRMLYFLDNPYLALQVISFLICFLFCFFALNFIKRWYVSLILILFFIFDLKLLSLQLNALRHGLGLGFLMLFFQAKTKTTYHSLILFFLLLGLIHFSFYLIAFLLFVDWWITLKDVLFPDLKRLLVHIAAGVLISLFVLSIVSFFGSKQLGSLEEGPSDVSGLGFIYWTFMFLYIWFMKPRTYKDEKMSLMYSLFIVIMIFYLSSYFIMPIFGRLINLAFPFIIIILLNRPKFLDVLIVFLMLTQAFYTFHFTNNFSTYIYISQKAFIQHILGI